MSTGFTRDARTGAVPALADHPRAQESSATRSGGTPVAPPPSAGARGPLAANDGTPGDIDPGPDAPRGFDIGRTAAAQIPPRSHYGTATFADTPGFDDMEVARALYHPDSGGYRRLGAGVAAVALVAGAAVAISANGSDSTADDTPGLVSALTRSAHAEEPEEPVISAAALIPGYRAVVAPDSDAAYDVPADWIIASPGYSGGFGDSPDTIGGKGYASEGKDYCPGSTRTVSFLTGSPDTDATAAALDTATKAARIAYAVEAVPTTTEPLSSLDGGQHGTFVEARGRIDNPAPGCAPAFSVYTFATGADTGSLVMVIAADTGVPKAVDPATARRIFASIRPYKP
ncbi:hypothetical protein IU449_26145 [Nocardia higoensis]|uniref:DUF8017 domain-containing protein n=1 Tax=Nocardia higoensis TaxID=228599 RepID=A0ABS0DHN5_9NOCA|nr:hypothetical protein [Nocardia higoensis]MBF6357981.1 hypothetical protein [Nocardia higoensis]